MAGIRTTAWRRLLKVVASRSWVLRLINYYYARTGLSANDARSWYFRMRSLTKVMRLRSRSEEHTSELQSLMRISYAVFCLKKKKQRKKKTIKEQKPTILTT